jgi:integrase
MKGHIRERSPGRWAIVIDVNDDKGQRRRKWHSFAGTKRQAQDECARLISALRASTYVEPNRITIAQFLEKWLTHMQAQVAPRTHERYTEIVRKNLVPRLGAIVLAKLQPVQVSEAYATALRSGRCDGTGGLSARSVLHMHRILKQALAQAVQWNLIVRNPAAGKPPKVPLRKMQTYDVEQTAELIEVLRGTRLFVPVLLAALCGLRRGEIVALRWAQVDLDGAQIAIVQSAEKTRSGVRYKEPKSGRARTVALSATMVDELRAHRARQAQELLRLGVRLSDATCVCARADGLPLHPDTLTIDWLRKIAGTSLPRLRFHDLRHAHATHMLASGVHPKVASERLGHSKVGITLDLYSHVLPNMQADAAALVDDALRAALNKRRTKG